MPTPSCHWSSTTGEQEPAAVPPSGLPPLDTAHVDQRPGQLDSGELQAADATAGLHRPCAWVLDFPVDCVTEAGAIDRILAWVRAPRCTHLVVPVNAAILVMMRRDGHLREACVQAEMIVPDGQPVVWASRLLGHPLPERVAGCTLMERLLEKASNDRLRVYFLGARPEVVERLVQRCRQDWPGLVVAGYRDGYFAAADEPQIAEQIRQARADILFVGLPSPRKELFCHTYRHGLDTPVVIPVGGSLDVLAGFIRRAPRWMQRWGLEWTWRLAMEPRKLWRRYLKTNTLFVVLVARALLGRGPKRPRHFGR